MIVTKLSRFLLTKFYKLMMMYHSGGIGTASGIRNALNMRSRTKECHICEVEAEALYRCRYDGLRDWLFLCGKCLTEVKVKHEKTYQYGGTWKSKKR